MNSYYKLCDQNSSESEKIFFYIVDKGSLEYELDGELYMIGSGECLSTKALSTNAKKTFYVSSGNEQTFVFRLSIEKFKSIVTEFVNKLHEEKVSIIKSLYLFKYLDRKVINEIGNISNIKTYKKRKVIITEGKDSEYIYILIEGEVTCGRNNHLNRKLYKNEIFGDMWIYTQLPSVYSYIVEANSKVLRFKVDSFMKLFEDNCIIQMVSSIFNNKIKEFTLISKYFYEGNIKSLFDIFELKYYYKNCVLSKKYKKVLLLLSGRLIKKTKVMNGSIEGYMIEEDLHIHGELFAEEVLSSYNQTLPFEIYSDEAIVFEANWIDILKLTKSYNNKKYSIYTIINLFRNHFYFTRLNEKNLFQLAENFKFVRYKKGERILKNGPSSDKFFTLLSGTVAMDINNIEVKTLSSGQSFGDIISTDNNYAQKATYYAKTNVDAMYIEAEAYKEIIDLGVIKSFTSSLNLKDITLTIEQLFYVKELGQGAFGKVYLVHDNKTFYAMKTAEVKKMIQDKETAQLYLNEKRILNSMNYPFIVQLINTYKTKDYIFFLMELVNGTSLRQYIDDKTKNSFRNIKEFTFIAAILGTILNYLQRNRIIHRDFKPDNLMLDNKGYLKAIDFGVAKFLTGKDTTNTLVGTLHYMAPEVILRKNYSFAVDFWSIGVILFEVFYGKLPFGCEAKDPQMIYHAIQEDQLVLASDIKYEGVNGLIRGLLNKNPMKRLKSFDKYKSMSIFEDFNYELLYKKEMVSPLKVVPVVNDKKEQIKNHEVQFIQFIQNNIFYSSNDLSEINNDNTTDFLTDF